jgi:hypothetical protein
MSPTGACFGAAADTIQAMTRRFSSRAGGRGGILPTAYSLAPLPALAFGLDRINLFIITAHGLPSIVISLIQNTIHSSPADAVRSRYTLCTRRSP